MRQKLLIVIIGGFLIGVVAGLALLLTLDLGQPPIETSGTALIGGPFTLVDQTGKTVTDADYAGRYRLIFFGFTHCADICPAELQVMVEALDRLGDKADKVVPIFITLDPERDTPTVMADYVKNFSPRLVGLTGSPEQVAAAAKAYRIIFTKVEDPDSANGYTVDHSALAYLMGPDGSYVDHFAYGTGAEAMAEKLKRYL
ncbi:MAG: SCO family protein [Methyloceanibacter sp.]